jgi:hypothetical protein
MWVMVRDECVGGPKEGALKVLVRTSGSEKKKNWMASLLIFVAKKKVAWIWALIPINPELNLQN